MRIGTRSALFVAMLVAMIVGGLFVGPQALRAQTNPTVVITVVDTNSSPVVGVPVYAFNGTTYTNINGATDANGQSDPIAARRKLQLPRRHHHR
ncbi:MAG: hypothetical protein R2856_27040 [Caldilineaceae bacterium]